MLTSQAELRHCWQLHSCWLFASIECSMQMLPKTWGLLRVKLTQIDQKSHFAISGPMSPI